VKVAVVGAGIVGAATARALARRGIEVELIDAGEVSGGTTGLGEGNVLCSDKHGGPELELALLGRAAYDEIEAAYGERARIRRKGALVVHRSEAGLAAEAGRIERLRAAGVECELLEPGQARALEPELSGGILGATWVPGDLQCDPRAIARAMAEEPGVTVRTHTRVQALSALRADEVVLAAGPWSAALAATAGLHLPVEPRKGQLVRLGGRLDVRHKVVDGGYLAAVAAPEAGLQVSTVIETTHDGAVLVGSSRERTGFDTNVDPAVTTALLAAARELVPGVAALAPQAAWAGLRPWLPDGLPAIGRSRTGLWVATGHEGAGVGLGPITGELLAAAISGAAPPLSLAPFDPDRFAGAARTGPPATARRPPAARG
jgi:glycine/D-amino acid oxidase-like deaminating enzyme